jgi:predicted AlkP superfamily pyrophosphatase or phosphodiesterase
MRPLALALALLTLIVTLPQASRAQARGAVATPDVKLVLLVAVDQYRYDYLTRFRGQFTGGLAQMLARGATFTQAYLDHYPTVTAVGHATMLTGAKPAVSGIIGNDWFDRGLGASVTSVSDPATQLVGGVGTGSSPHRLLVSTLGDEMKNAAGDRAPEQAPKVFGLSLKDRSAVLPAGHRGDGAYWYDTKTGSFVTSTYYRPEPHPWVAAFNARKQADGYAGVRWEFLDPATGPGRGMPATPGPQLYNAVFGSPFGNDLLRDFALAGLEAERLGQRGVTDVLSVSFSSNDSVGHTFGPDSPEVRDIAIRVDRVIGDLLARVEALVGLEKTIVVFTTDHGVAPVPEVQQQRRLPGGRMKADELFGPISAALTAKFGEGKWILATAGTSPYLNHALIAEKGLDPAEVRRVAAAAAAGVPHVARVYTREQLLAGAVLPDVVGRRIAQSYHLQRSGDLELVLDPYWLRSTAGTTHGTPYSYDAHIPLLLMGPGIRPGAYHGTAALNDVAPTLAAMLGVENPSGADGRVLTEALAPATAPARPRGTQ